jgi:hypothetical protein
MEAFIYNAWWGYTTPTLSPQNLTNFALVGRETVDQR